MDYGKYYEAREILVDIMQKDLLGPVTIDEIICEERPLDYYVLGKLYPQNVEAAEVAQSSSEDCGELQEDADISLSNSKNPSSFGISFSLNRNINSFIVNCKAAQYELITEETARSILGFSEGTYKSNARFWKRIELPINPNVIFTEELTVGVPQKINLTDNLSVRILLHKIYSDDTKTITVTIVNDNISSGDRIEDCVNAFFQPQITISSNESCAFCDVRRNVYLNQNSEIAELDMLYSNVGDYASGHGCAVNWETTDNGEPVKLFTDFFPSFEVLQMMPSANFKSSYLNMKKLSESKKDDVISGLKELTDTYSVWISNLENHISDLQEHMQDSATTNIKKCKKTLNTLVLSIDALSDDTVFKAFSLANEAMFLQRKQMLLITKKYTSDENINWYPFQLAFFLQEIISFAKPECAERSMVDLLWFPTGGGKTEAYLGIAAFTIFLRRLKHGELGNGVTVLMRYTLRLLSFQQFERASALICACEYIRRKKGLPGGEIGIGLWAGKALTPNKIADADKILHGETDKDAESSNPVQLERCPWCGKPISAVNYKCDLAKKRMNIYCADSNCVFHSGLPVYLIDEEIYEHTPAFIVATIDKFAQVALNYETASLFGTNKNVLPPELIIQDELHLISGPLGTITGLYEAAIKKLCTKNGVMPKIIASTATIRNAKEQILSLYAAEYTQFPPQGIDINNSFFAEISTKNQKPARLYLGCMAIGTSPTTMMIRVMTSLLYASRYLAEQGYDDKVIDSFWTITGYFNTLRELGGAIIRVVDDIQDRFNYLKNSKFKVSYPITKGKNRYDLYKELTSREKSENIGAVIQKELKEEYKSDGSTSPYDFLLSSNMISVGVDVGRLGSMIVVGQPKTTSEYIQATSRVGRETPGLVITTYNQAKSRDRSHYEDFTQYHSMFYRFVEATSVTPFSDRARDRALQALYVILCRNLISELSGNDDAIKFDRSIPQLQEIRDYICDYVKRVDPDEYEHVLKDIDEIEYYWEDKASRRDKLKYRKTKFASQNDVLFEPDYNENSRFRVLNTMRSVETSVKVTTSERR